MTVIIVSYNTRASLARCLDSVIRKVSEVIVIDNASHDGSSLMVTQDFPSVVLRQNELNRGFGAANNQGMEIAKNELILLLNSDCVAKPDSIELLARVFEDKTVVAAGGKLVFPEGRPQESAANKLNLWAVFCEQTYLEKLFPRLKWLNSYWVSSSHGKRAEVEQVMGACLMMRRLEQFDERFFLYCEDTELCHRLRKHGSILFVPEAEFIHELGASSTGLRRWEAVARYNKGKELYFWIHAGRFAWFLCLILNRLGAMFRLIVWGILGLISLFLIKKIRHQCGLWIKVLLCPVGGPPRPHDSVSAQPGAPHPSR